MIPMKMSPLSQVLELPVADRLKLVELIWDSIAARPDEMPISDSVRAELDRRLLDLREDPESVYDWDVEKAKLPLGRWRSD